jgi:hypothetical protein
VCTDIEGSTSLSSQAGPRLFAALLVRVAYGLAMSTPASPVACNGLYTSLQSVEHYKNMLRVLSRGSAFCGACQGVRDDPLLAV